MQPRYAVNIDTRVTNHQKDQAMKTGSKLLVWILLLCAGQPSVAFETARMTLPEGFTERTERIAIVGYGGRNKGEYRLGPYAGTFTRIETRWAVADPFFAASRASASYTIDGPGFDETVAAVCGMKKNTVTVGVVTFDPKKMTYQCTLERGGQLMDARFVLGQPKPDTMKKRFLAWAVREGEASIGGVTLRMSSVHKYSGSRFDSPTPVGYLLEVGGQSVGAIELTDVNPTIFLPTDTTAEVREAVLLAAMALSVLRDPADSMLGDEP